MYKLRRVLERTTGRHLREDNGSQSSVGCTDPRFLPSCNNRCSTDQDFVLRWLSRTICRFPSIQRLTKRRTPPLARLGSTLLIGILLNHGGEQHTLMIAGWCILSGICRGGRLSYAYISTRYGPVEYCPSLRQTRRNIGWQCYSIHR